MVNVDTVYKTVLYILNKEQRGYMPPAEFNSVATQVQLEIFEQYFEELNQQLRVPENDSELIYTGMCECACLRVRVYARINIRRHFAA